MKKQVPSTTSSLRRFRQPAIHTLVVAAVAGRGAGGLLVGAAITQRPELFGAALIDTGILDMTRFNRFTVGSTWLPASRPPERPACVSRLSPLQGVKPDWHYPPVLITVGDHDDESYAGTQLQVRGGASVGDREPAPALLRVDYDAGFGRESQPPGNCARQRPSAFLVDVLHVVR
jgi:prolyl oligopeptidase